MLRKLVSICDPFHTFARVAKGISPASQAEYPHNILRFSLAPSFTAGLRLIDSSQGVLTSLPGSLEPVISKAR